MISGKNSTNLTTFDDLETISKNKNKRKLLWNVLLGLLFVQTLVNIYWVFKGEPQELTAHSLTKSNATQTSVELSIEEETDQIRSRIFEHTKTLQEPISCETANFLIHPVVYKCGFGCVFNDHILFGLAHAHRENKTLVFRDEKILIGHNWSEWFQPISTCQSYFEQNMNTPEVKSRTTIVTQRRDNAVHIANHDSLPNYAWDFLKHHQVDPYPWFMGILAKYAWRFQPDVDQYIKQKTIELQIPDNLDFGVHIRRSDKVSWGDALQFELREYVNEMDHLAHPGRIYHGSYGQKYDMSVYLATDSPQVFPQLTKYSQYDWYYHNDGAERANTDEVSRMNDITGMKGLFFDLQTMMNAKYFVGTLSSNLGRIMYIMSANKYLHFDHYTLSLDEGWHGNY